MNETDTIFALATGAGRGAIAIIRISGPDAGAILDSIASPRPPPRHAAVRKLRARDGDILDRAVVLRLPAPSTYTGEDMAELQLHASPAVIDAAMETLRALGARPAEPGEFTRRAFLNGRVDLLQAEGIADLIEAETQAQRRQALAQAEGGLSVLQKRWSASIRRILALQEASIDFPDESDDGRSEADALRLAAALRLELSNQLHLATRAQTLRRGVVVAIVGPPNVGKSSLMNHLAGRDVSIVSAQAGTTRDVLEARIVLADIPVTLLDTAGLRNSDEVIEREGVARALRAASAADAVMEVITASEVPSGRATLLVFNKVDLHPPRHGAIGVSARTGEGLDDLRHELAKIVRALASSGHEPAITRERHRDCLEGAIEHLDRAGRIAIPELRGEEYRLAAHHLGRLTGTVSVEDVLGEIFSSFCIGK